MIEMKVEWAGHGSKLYSTHTETFDEQRLSFIETVAPTPWKGKTNYSTYAILDAEGKKIATLPDGTKDTTVDGGYLRELFVVAPQLLAEVLRLQSKPTVTVEDYHEKGHLYVTVRFPDGDEYVGLVEKWEGEEE